MWDVLLIFSVPVFVLVEVVVLYSVWRFRMRPGEELKDGPPIHGNTRLEIIWTAIPAILLVCLCSYAYIVLTDIEEAEARALDVRVVGEQFTWTFHYRGPDGQDARVAAALRARGPAGQLHRPVQGRPARLLGAGLPHEDRRGARASTRTSASRRTGSASTRSSARSCAASATPSCARRRTSSLPADFDTWLQERAERREAAAAAGGEEREGGGGGGGRGRRGRSSPRPAAGTATRWPTRTPRATSGPDLDDALADQDDAAIRESIVDPNAEVAERLHGGHHAARLRADAGAGGDRRARGVPCQRDPGMTEAN